jgi:hypothetical protein
MRSYGGDRTLTIATCGDGGASINQPEGKNAMRKSKTQQRQENGRVYQQRFGEICLEEASKARHLSIRLWRDKWENAEPRPSDEVAFAERVWIDPFIRLAIRRAFESLERELDDMECAERR